MPVDLRISLDEEALWADICDWLEIQILDVLHHQKVFNMAIPGGATPAGLLRYLASSKADHLPWSHIHFWWTDERCVEPTDPRSNFGMAYKDLLKPRGIPEEQIHRIMGELEPRRAAVRYAIHMEDTLCRRFTSIPFFDLTLIGLGQDGHVASLYPNHEFREPHPWAVISLHDGVERVSLPYEVITSSSRVAFLVTGRHKAEIVRTVLDSKLSRSLDLPASLVLQKRPDAIWFLDQDAGSLLN